MGITLFFTLLFVAFFLGKINYKTLDKKNIIKPKKKITNSDSISPDARWLQSKDN